MNDLPPAFGFVAAAALLIDKEMWYRTSSRPLDGSLFYTAAAVQADAILSRNGYNFSFCGYCGYPVNYQIAMEVVDLYAENKEEREYLKRELVTRVVLGGVVSVSMMSVIVAGILVNLL